MSTSYPQFLPVPGPPGPPGKDGCDGHLGPPGQMGPGGSPGVPGNEGPRGSMGPPGLCGQPGSDGPQGVPGELGQRGYQGDLGNQGHAGEDGTQGVPGAPGDVGTTTFEFTVETAESLVGPAINTEVITNGETIRFWSAGGVDFNLQSGSALLNIEPNNIIASSGNPISSPKDPNRPIIYVNELNGAMWAWDTSRQDWDQKTGAGAEGFQGPQGNSGTIGVDGVQGSQGSQGYQGQIGVGSQGFQGVTGFQGIQGPLGIDGIQGNQGFQGFIGVGIQGSQGKPGDAGDVSSNSYTPAIVILSSTPNVDSVGAFTANYQRIGNILWVSGRLLLTKGGSGTNLINITVSLPSGLNRGSNDFISGHLTTTNREINGIVVQYAPNDAVVEIQGFAPPSSTFSSLPAHYTFTYTL